MSFWELLSSLNGSSRRLGSFLRIEASMKRFPSRELSRAAKIVYVVVQLVGGITSHDPIHVFAALAGILALGTAKRAALILGFLAV